MRMWLVEPRCMCTAHLMGEHNELHMLLGAIAKKKSLKGFIERGLIDTMQILDRHDELAVEMNARGHKHQSPISEAHWRKLENYNKNHEHGKVDTEKSKNDLMERCQKCRELFSRVR